MKRGFIQHLFSMRNHASSVFVAERPKKGAGFIPLETARPKGPFGARLAQLEVMGRKNKVLPQHQKPLTGRARARSLTGFTLIELLVVIAILAVLAVAVVVVMNPVELIKQARDVTRISDLAALNGAIALYLVDVSTSTFSSTGRCTFGTAQPTHMTLEGGTCSFTTSTAVDSNGWVPINFNVISSGSPLARLPMDPNNGATTCINSIGYCFYVFASNYTASTGNKYELNASMESAKYRTGGGSDVESNTKDGGTDNDWYEVGNKLDL